MKKENKLIQTDRETEVSDRRKYAYKQQGNVRKYCSTVQNDEQT